MDVLRQALVLAAAGVFVGLPLALWSSRYLGSLLYGLSPARSTTIALTGILLIVIASLAGYLPARRAALVDPARALKQD